MIEDRIEFEVRVSAGARRTRVVGRHGDRLKVQVAAAAERGRANRALRRLLADTLGVTMSDVEIVRGTSSPDKLIRVHGVADDALERLVPGLERRPQPDPRRPAAAGAMARPERDRRARPGSPRKR